MGIMLRRKQWGETEVLRIRGEAQALEGFLIGTNPWLNPGLGVVRKGILPVAV